MNSGTNGSTDKASEDRRFHDKKTMVLDLLQFFKPKYSKMLIHLSYETVKILHDSLNGRSKI